MLFTGWVSFFLAWVFTALFYKTHPSIVDSGWRGKLIIYVFGKKRYVCGYKGRNFLYKPILQHTVIICSPLRVKESQSSF